MVSCCRAPAVQHMVAGAFAGMGEHTAMFPGVWAGCQMARGFEATGRAPAGQATVHCAVPALTCPKRCFLAWTEPACLPSRACVTCSGHHQDPHAGDGAAWPAGVLMGAAVSQSQPLELNPPTPATTTPTFLQLQTSVGRVLSSVVRQEGVGGLYRGMGAMALGAG